MNTVKRAIRSLMTDFLLSIVITLIVLFFTNVLLTYDLVFRTVFWPLLAGIVVLDVLLTLGPALCSLLFLRSFIAEYRLELERGKEEWAAFKTAKSHCKVAPPDIIAKWAIRNIS